MSVTDLYFLKTKSQQDRLSFHCEFEKMKIGLLLGFTFFSHENIVYEKIAEDYMEGQNMRSK